MASETWELVGKVKEAHGLRGDLYVLLFAAAPEDVVDLEVAVLGALPPRGEARSENPGPVLRLEKCKPYKDGVIVKFAGCDDRTAAEKWRGQGFFVSAELFEKEDENVLDLEELRGFAVKDEGGAVLGEIVGFSSNGVQDLLVVAHAGGQAEIPFVEEFLVDLDVEGRAVVMSLPEGLFDLAGDE